MGMVVRTNTMALNAYRQLGMNNSAVAKSLEKLSSGFRINRAGDDAAGLAISEKMKAQITGLETASANAQDGISLIQTAEGNLNEVHDMLNRMVELATKSANGTYTITERKALQDEVDQLLTEIDRISQSANFNGTNLLDGTMGLNKEAFSAFAQGTGTLTTNVIDISKNLAAEGSAGVHLETVSGAGVSVGATIDLTGFKLATAATGASAATFTLKLGDKEFTVTNIATSVTGISGFISSLASAISASEYSVVSTSGEQSTTTANNNAIKLGTGVYTFTASGSKINLTMAGYFDDEGNYKVSDGKDLDKATADKINQDLGASVEASIEGRSIANGSKYVHALTNVKHATEKSVQQMAGIDLKLDTNLVSEGNVLTMDGIGFVFKTLSDDETEIELGNGVTWGVTDPATFLDADGNYIIDVSDYATDEEKIHAAADWMSRIGNAAITANVDGTAISRTWKIGTREDGATIHFEQDAATSDDDVTAGAKILKTYDDLAGLFSVTSKKPFDVEQKFISGTLDAEKLTSGDSVDIGGTKYTFVDPASETAVDKDAVKVELGKTADDTMKNLKAALKSNGYTAEVSGKSLKIFAKEGEEQGPALTGSGLTLQIGDTADTFNKMTVKVNDMSAAALGLGGLKITTEVSASEAIDKIKAAINSVSTTRAGMGALQNRLEHTINNLDVAAENLSSANSRIRDTDMAKEMMNYTKMNVLVQSAQAMLAQANQQPQSVLQLLQ